MAGLLAEDYVFAGRDLASTSTRDLASKSIAASIQSTEPIRLGLEYVEGRNPSLGNIRNVNVAWELNPLVRISLNAI
jgi:hypothetical protein